MNSPGNYKIQLASSDNVQRIMEFNKQFRLHGSSICQWEKCEWVSERVDEGGYWVAYDPQGGDVAGAICLDKDDSSLCICTIAVDPARHGQGIGRLLIDFAIDYCRQSEATRLRLQSYVVYGVREFYEKCGFRCTNPHSSTIYSFTMDVNRPEPGPASGQKNGAGVCPAPSPGF